MSVSEQKISISKMKKFCINHINNVNISHRNRIFALIKLKANPEYIFVNSDGTRVLIDKLEDGLITDIYNLLKSYLNKYNEL